MKKTIVVLCGSMKVKQDIIKIKEALEKRDYEVLLPIECMQGLPKEIASRAHFDRIQDKKTDIVLIVNATKNGIKNYIGPNSFAEIAFAFYNITDEPIVISKDEKLGQGMFVQYKDVTNYVDEDVKERTGGFGSTGQ